MSLEDLFPPRASRQEVISADVLISARKTLSTAMLRWTSNLQDCELTNGYCSKATKFVVICYTASEN